METDNFTESCRAGKSHTLTASLPCSLPLTPSTLTCFCSVCPQRRKVVSNPPTHCCLFVFQLQTWSTKHISSSDEQLHKLQKRPHKGRPWAGQGGGACLKDARHLKDTTASTPPPELLHPDAGHRLSNVTLSGGRSYDFTLVSKHTRSHKSSILFVG